VGVFLNGRGIRERDHRGEPIVDKHFIILFNAGDDDIDFHIPAPEFSPKWNILVDTAGEQADGEPLDPGSSVRLPPKALMVLSEHEMPEPEIDHSVAASLAALTDNTTMPAHSPKSELER
jgi:glycogen operon protein